MNKAVRKAVIAGNWKMNKTPAEATELLNAIMPLVKDAGCDVVACVPYVDIAAAHEREDRRGELPLGKERRLHRRNLR